MDEKDIISTKQDDKINLNNSHVNERPVQKDKVSTKTSNKKKPVETDETEEDEENNSSE